MEDGFSAHFGEFAERTHELFCIADQQFFLKLNSAWESALGYTCRELTSRPFREFVHPDDLERTDRVVGEMRNGHLVNSFMNRYRCKDGSFRVLSWRATQWDNGITYAVARDVTTDPEGVAFLEQVSKAAR